MHQGLMSELVRIKIAEELEYAARERLARGAAVDRSPTIEMAKVVQRVRVRIFGSGTPAGPTVAVGGRAAAGANA